MEKKFMKFYVLVKQKNRKSDLTLGTQMTNEMNDILLFILREKKN